MTDSEDENLEFKAARRSFDSDKETNKALLMDHIGRNNKEGSPLGDLQDVLPALSSKQIQYFLTAMREAGAVHLRGRTRGARWHLGAQSVEDRKP